MLRTNSIRHLRGLIKLLFGPKTWSLFVPVIAVFHKLHKECGYKYTIKYFKTSRLCITRYICGKPLRAVNERIALRNGIPVKFYFLKKYLDGGDPKDLRVILTIFQLSKYYQPTRKELSEAKPDYNSITDGYKGKQWTIPTWFIADFVKHYNLKAEYPEYNASKHYFSMKGSPYGKSSLGSLRVTELPYPVLENIYRILRHKVEWFTEFYNKVFNSNLVKSFGTPAGKLSIVEDSELKKRVIAMVDYHSQYLLRPIHDEIMSKLRHFPCDRTYSQDPFSTNWEKQGLYHSLDLSSATDRFPISLQVKLLRRVYDHDLAVSWRNLLLDRDYASPEGNLLRYSVGQPMGAYSSWAVFTLTHHLTVCYAAWRCGYKIGDFKSYLLLGDDIVIKNDRVSQVYQSIVKRLGVDISLSKSHVSKDTYEFAKRWIKGNTEITGLPLKGIGANLSNYKVVYLLLLSYFEKVPGLYKGDLCDIVAKLYNRYRLKTNRYLSYQRVFKELTLFMICIKFSKGTLYYQDLRRVILNNIGDTADFMFPPEKECWNWFKTFLSHGLAAHVQSANKKILQVTKPIKEKYQGNLDIVKESPLVIGISNHIERSKALLEAYLENDGKDIFDIASEISLIDTSSLFSRTNEKVTVMDSILKKSLRTYLPKDGIIYYGSSMGSSSVDTSYLITSSMWNMEFAIMQIGNELKDVSEVSYDAWGRPVR
uniref:RNA-dependent RNA polymerase n=1 Tax=Diaporthe helianthi mitovirus 1 TaxID=3077433 RepID=A0AA96HAD6_9VIRU|nr:MAG: RNA-dependent RNA polymerase [Diaporthe helianthi mitovirus 1]